MTFSLIPRAEIELSRQNEVIIRETAYQVIKDFRTFGMDIDFPSDLNFAYDELLVQLKNKLLFLMQSCPAKLSSLMYHIDLDEKTIRTEKVELFYEHEWIAGLILEREFLKVLTRLYFMRNK